MGMEAAHNTMLNDLIREVLDLGSARISERVLVGCHERRKNLSRSIWRDLEQRFQDQIERREDEDWSGYWLAALRRHGLITLVALEPLNKSDSEGWWEPVAPLAGVPLRNMRIEEGEDQEEKED